MSKSKNIMLSIGLNSALGFIFAFSGCSSPQEVASAPTNPTHENEELPDQVVKQLTACLEQGAARLGAAQHSITFNARLTKHGEVGFVEIKSSTLEDHDLEECLSSAVRVMQLPKSVTALRFSNPAFEADGAATPETRTLVATPALALPLVPVISLGPLALGVGLAVVVVAVVVYATSEPTVPEVCPLIKVRYQENGFTQCLYQCRERQRMWVAPPRHECPPTYVLR